VTAQIGHQANFKVLGTVTLTPAEYTDVRNFSPLSIFHNVPCAKFLSLWFYQLP